MELDLAGGAGLLTGLNEGERLVKLGWRLSKSMQGEIVFYVSSFGEKHGRLDHL